MQATILLVTFADQPRRYKAIFYLLQGKQTISNLFAGQEYDLLNQFHLYPNLKWSDYQASLRELAQAGLVTLDSKQALVTLTAAGQTAREQLLARDFWPRAYDYWRMGAALTQWTRLLLAVQVVSNLDHQIKHYQPLTESINVQGHVKRWLRRWGRQGSQGLAGELGQAFNALPPRTALIIANSFWSDYDPGVSAGSLAQALGLTAAELPLAQIDCLGQLLTFVHGHAAAYPVLAQLLPVPASPLNASAGWTYQQVLSGKSWTKLTHDSRLKASTLKEHLLQAAILCPDFALTAPAIQQLLTLDPDGYFSQRIQELTALGQFQTTAQSSQQGGVTHD